MGRVIDAERAYKRGRTYYTSSTGNRSENLERAIVCFEDALLIYTPESFPQEWARLQEELTDAYRELAKESLRQTFLAQAASATLLSPASDNISFTHAQRVLYAFILGGLFLGYILGGWSGTLLATLGIFLPSFCFIALIHPIASRLREKAGTAILLDGVNAAALALMAGVLIQLGRRALVDLLTWTVALVSLLLLLRFKLNSVWLILAGAALGLLRSWVLKVQDTADKNVPTSS